MEQQKSAASAFEGTTLSQKADILAGLAMFPALTMMVFLRRKIGYRFLSPMKLQVMTLFILALSAVSIATAGQPAPVTVYGGLSVTPAAPSPTALATPFFVFAFAMLITGMVKRFLQWQNIKKGVSWHTYSRGVSWFAFLPLSDSIIKRYVDPAAVAIVGLLVMLIFKWLGYYIIFSAFCLFIFETWDYDQQLNRMLDTLDDLVDSEVVSGNVDYYSRDGKAEQRPLEETAGIPTGIAPDIAVQIQKRRNRRQQAQVTPPQRQAAMQAKPVPDRTAAGTIPGAARDRTIAVSGAAEPVPATEPLPGAAAAVRTATEAVPARQSGELKLSGARAGSPCQPVNAFNRKLCLS